MEGFKERLGRAAALLREARNVAVFTGAGISTESGIADFRSPGGVWERYRIVTFQEFTSSAEARREYWAMKRDLFGKLARARPNRAHTAIARLHGAGKLRCVITQNIDGLHQKGAVRRSRLSSSTARTSGHTASTAGAPGPTRISRRGSRQGTSTPGATAAGGS